MLTNPKISEFLMNSDKISWILRKFLPEFWWSKVRLVRSLAHRTFQLCWEVKKWTGREDTPPSDEATIPLVRPLAAENAALLELSLAAYHTLWAEPFHPFRSTESFPSFSTFATFLFCLFYSSSHSLSLLTYFFTDLLLTDLHSLNLLVISRLISL